MAERSSLTQVVQIGTEATPGAGGTITKKFQTLGIEPTPNVNIDQFRPAGTKYRHMTALNREWITAAVTGRGSYTELVYPLSSWLTQADITTPQGATNARLWTFTPHTSDEDDPITYTVEHGSSARADKFNYGIFTDFGMTFSRDTIDLTGSMLAQSMTDDITLTSNGVTSVELVPILAGQVSVYMDSTAAGLGSTKLLRLVNASFSGGGKYGPLWVVDAANPSFATHIETEPDVNLQITLEADDQGMGLLASMRSADRKFIRIEAIGPEIETDQDYKFQLDFSGEITDTGGFSDADGLYAIQWTFTAVHDATWTKAYEFKVQNALTAL